jgi:hypothetical protein
MAPGAQQGPPGPPGAFAPGITVTGGTALLANGVTFHCANATVSQCVFVPLGGDPDGAIHKVAWIGGVYGCVFEAPEGLTVLSPQGGGAAPSYAYRLVGEAYEWTLRGSLYVPF